MQQQSSVDNNQEEISFSRPRLSNEKNLVEVIEGYFSQSGIDLAGIWRKEKDIQEILDSNPYVQQYVIARNLASKLVVITMKSNISTESARFAINIKVPPDDFLENVKKYALPTFEKALQTNSN